MAAGPKRAITADPLDFSEYPKGRSARRLRFIEDFLVVPKGFGAGEPVRLRPFQREIVKGAFAKGVREALVSIPRGNGKTGLAAMLALAELFVGAMGAEVLVVASDQRQANITLRMAKRMVELNPLLTERVQVFQDRLYVPHTDATLMPLPADPGALHGYDPSLLIVDELHVVTEAVWEACTSAIGKRPESLTLAISTPATSKDSVMWRLVERGRYSEESSFYYREFAAPDGCAVDDRAAWRAANPAMSCRPPFLAEDALVSVQKTLREPVFRQLRLGQWVSGIGSWLPFGAWAEVADRDRVVERGAKICLGFDGSASGDSTAIVGCTIEAKPHLFVAGVWERPATARDWRVPRLEVDERIRDLFEEFNVVEFAADPWGWRTELETWQRDFGARRVVEFNTAYRKRMAPATDRLYQAVKEHSFTHDGNERMAIHVGNAIAKSTPQGDVIEKDKKQSKRKIDLAVAGIVAFDRAAFHNRKTSRRVVGF